jgi:hypothetical protein
VSAVRQATSRKAREVAHTQLLRLMFREKPALYFPVKVAHPPGCDEKWVANKEFAACSFRAYFLGEAGQVRVRVNEWEVLKMKIRPPAA